MKLEMVTVCWITSPAKLSVILATMQDGKETALKSYPSREIEGTSKPAGRSKTQWIDRIKFLVGQPLPSV